MDAHERLGAAVDAVLGTAAFFVRAACYAALAVAADHYDCGRALLTGVVLGDLAASGLAFALQPREHVVVALAELLLLAIAFVWVNSCLAWPATAPDQALLGLAAFGVFAARAGRSVMTRLLPSESDFA